MNLFSNKKLYEMLKEMSQLEIVEYHLTKYGKITDDDARNIYGDRRVSDKISKLRDRGYEIKTHMIKGKNRFGKPTEYAVYELIKKPDITSAE